MQEESSQKTVALVVRAARLTEEILKRAIIAYLRDQAKMEVSEPHGKMSVKELLGIKDRRALVNEKAADYKPLAKIEELEEENYNQIDNYLSNTISPAEEKRQRILRSEVRRAEERPSVRARLREGKAKMEAEKQRKAMMTRQRITEKTK